MAQCTARSKRSGEQCRRSAIPGGRVCAVHGGNAPHVRAAGARVVERERVEREVALIGVPEDVTPREYMAGMLNEAAGNVAALRRLLVDSGDLVMVGGELHPAVQLYGQERDRALRAAKALQGLEQLGSQLTAGVNDAPAVGDGRFIVQESQRDVLARAAVEAVRRPELGLTREQQAGVVAAIAEECRDVTFGEAILDREAVEREIDTWRDQVFEEGRRQGIADVTVTLPR